MLKYCKYCKVCKTMLQDDELHLNGICKACDIQVYKPIDINQKVLYKSEQLVSTQEKEIDKERAHDRLVHI